MHSYKIISVKWSDYCNLGLETIKIFRDKIEAIALSVIVNINDDKIYFRVHSYNVKNFIEIVSIEYNMETTIYKKLDSLDGYKENVLYNMI